jgi:serine-type D-Ala-D-Ala carboxypeptidase (penicillin-binding protein 5/6)
MKAILIFVFLLFPGLLFGNDAITAPSYVLAEHDSFQIIAGKNYHDPLPPASTTKIMTTILALERLEGTEAIRAGKGVAEIPRSKLNLISGKEYVAMDLIKGIMVESANDAAHVVAVHVGGTEDRFADMMTAKAKEIGALNTRFKNASGLYATGHLSTCYDLALILRYALSLERFPDIAATKYFLFENQQRSVRYKNHNRLLFCFEHTIAGKTGFTRASRHCYVGAFEKDGKIYLLAMLGSRDLWGDAVKILKVLYDHVPTDREISLARSHAITLTSFKQKQDKPAQPKKRAKAPKTAKKAKKAGKK